MSGSPSEAEVQAQWKAAVDILETMRNLADGTLAGAGGKFDTLLQALEGEYTPDLAGQVASFRATLSGLLSRGTARGFLDPVMYEYARLLSDGAGLTALPSGQGQDNPAPYGQNILAALYEHFVTNSELLKSRNITFDTSASTSSAKGGSITGNGTVYRLTTDADGYDIEACTVETKELRCIRDQNSGTREHAEEFIGIGDAASPDNLLRTAFGSGISAAPTIISRHAGTVGPGGSLLRNSSFTSYSASGSPKFTGWTETQNGDNCSQTTEYYRGDPSTGTGTNYALKITGDGGDDVILTQTLTRTLDPTVPYFCRAMVRADDGSAVGGDFILTVGGVSKTVSIAAIVDAGDWYEVKIDIGANCWFENFNADPVTVSIEWDSHTSGYIEVDDVYFGPWSLWDGTWWLPIATNTTSHTPWLRDDILKWTDTGGAPATAKLQYYLWLAYNRYLPADVASPTIADP